MRLLLIEDEPLLQQQLRERLTREGYALDIASDGEEGLYLGSEYPVDLAIVDLGLPRLSGLQIIEQWRADNKAFPILILTARGRWQDKVEGLEAGADDYLAKPFEVEELLARIRALLRRAAGKARPVIDCQAIQIDTSAKSVTLHGDAIPLTSYEYKVLEYLALHHNKVISKTELTEHIYAQDYERDSNVIEVFVKRLRKKLDPDQTLKPIETLRGRGYRFALPVNQAPTDKSH